MSGYAIPAATITVVGITESSDLLTGKGFSMKPVIGGFVMGVFLYAISEVNDRLALMFAIIIVLATVIEHGQPLLDRLSKNPAPTKKGKRK